MSSEWMWDSFRSRIGLDDREIFTITCSIIHFIAYFMHGWLFVLADWYGFLDRYCIRSGKHKLPSTSQQWLAIRDATIDSIIVKPALFYFLFPYVGHFISLKSAPSIYNIFIQWLLMKIIFSTSLFWVHGAMHYFPFIYKNFHKKHHTFHESVAFAAQYAHPVEGLMSASHIISGILLVRPHFISFSIFLFTQLIEIVDSHAGYDVPWSVLYPWSDRYPWGAGARAHDYHHSHNIGMYGGGLTGLWDSLFGTDAEFRAFEKQRHVKLQNIRASPDKITKANKN